MTERDILEPYPIIRTISVALFVENLCQKTIVFVFATQIDTEAAYPQKRGGAFASSLTHLEITLRLKRRQHRVSLLSNRVFHATEELVESVSISGGDDGVGEFKGDHPKLPYSNFGRHL
jgi:hypothetical protein